MAGLFFVGLFLVAAGFFVVPAFLPAAAFFVVPGFFVVPAFSLVRRLLTDATFFADCPEVACTSATISAMASCR